jgi:hypothetical protein
MLRSRGQVQQRNEHGGAGEKLAPDGLVVRPPGAAGPRHRTIRPHGVRS